MYKFSSESFFENVLNKVLNKVLAYWKKNKDSAKELANDGSSLLPANIQTNKEQLFNHIARYYNGEINKQQIQGLLKTGFILLNCLCKEEQDKIINAILDTECGINTNVQSFTENQYDIYHEIINHLLSKRRDTINQLLKKAAQKFHNDNNSISIALIKFLETIDDEQLKNIKEMMRYITKTREGFYQIITVFGKDANECRQKQGAEMNVYLLFETGTVFFDYNREIFADFIENDLTISSHTIPANSFVSGWGKLNRVGIELYRLLQDELAPYPQRYINTLFQQ